MDKVTAPIPNNNVTTPVIIPTIGITPKAETIVKANRNNQNNRVEGHCNRSCIHTPIETETIILETYTVIP